MEALKFKHSIRIKRDQKTVWEALTQSKWTRKYMYGSDVHSTWEKGSDIKWTGTYMGVDYVLKGTIKEIDPGHMLCYTNFDPAGTLEDIEANYLHISYYLRTIDGETEFTSISENFNGNKARYEEAKQGWEMVMNDFKKILEA